MTRSGLPPSNLLVIFLGAFLIVSAIAKLGSASAAASIVPPREPAMVHVAGGTLMLGDPGWRHTPTHRVTLGSFFLGRYEITREEFAAFAYDTGGLHPGEQGTPGHLPATGMTWFRAARYAEWLSAKTGRSYRLPTAAEWEAAARIAGAGAYEWGDDPPQAAGRRSNLADLSAQRHFAGFGVAERFPLAEAGYDDGHASLAPPASYAPNSLGIHDMTGNAAEWCSDPFVSDVVPGDGPFRAVRGSSFMTRRIEEARIGRLLALPADTRHIALGFRLARSE